MCDEGPKAEVPGPDVAEDQNITLLLQASEAMTRRLKEVQHTIAAFRAQEAVCVASPGNIEALFQLSTCALRLFDAIRAAHIESYFRPSFLEELEKISATAKNKVIPPITTDERSTTTSCH
jgi:hypothetical protein